MSFKDYLYRKVDEGLLTKKEVDIYLKREDRFKNTNKYSLNQLKKMVIKELKNNKTKTVHPSVLVEKWKVSGIKLGIAMRVLEREGRIRL